MGLDPVESRKILKELVSMQLKNIPIDKKLRYKDLHRITKYIDSSIFSDECCCWNGYVTNLKNVSKGTYINFYFRNKKVALHRLLYNNFVGVMDDDEYLKFSCDNRGKCCNVNHMIKYKYNGTHDETTDTDGESKKSCKKHKNAKKTISNAEIAADPKNFILTFD